MKIIAAHALNAVVRGEEAIDVDFIALEQFGKTAALAQEIGKGFIYLAAGGGFGAFVEVAELLGVELEEFEAVHAEPLMHKAADKFVRLVAGDHAIHLAREHLGLREIRLEKLLIRRSAPEEIGEAGGELCRGQGDNRTMRQ